MEEGRQRDGGRGCPPGPEGKRLFIELGELTFHLTFEPFCTELQY